MAALPKLASMDGTRIFALVAIVVVTFFMVLLNTTGAWQASHNVYYTGVIAGIELLEVACLVLILRSPTTARKIVGSLVFACVVYVCVENGKIAVTESFASVFKDEAGQPLHPAALRDKATIAETDAGTLKTEAPADRKAVKNELAELKVFQTKMSAMSPEGIKEAQSEMIPKCGYTGRVDGIRNVLTEAAMRKCGEQTANRILVLQAMDNAPVSAASSKSNQAVELRAKADEIDNRTIWMNIILFAVAGIQAAGLWAFVDWRDSKGQRNVSVDPDVFRDLQEQSDELARRKANIDDGVDRALKTKTRKRNRAQTLKILEDQRAEAEKVAAAEKQKIDDAIAAMSTEEVDEDDEALDLTEPAAAEPAPETPAPVAEAAPETPQPGTDLVVTETPEPPTEESDGEDRKLQAAE